MTCDLNAQRTISQLIAERPGRVRVFERFGVDCCCGGSKTLVEACLEKGVDSQEVLRELYEYDHEVEKARRLEEMADWSKAGLAELTEHIERTHHAYLKEELPRLAALAQKVAHRHGARNANLIKLADYFLAFKEQLELHMMKEDTVLFPMFKQLEQADSLPNFHCGSLANPISVMEYEHVEADRLLGEMRRLTGNYTLPEDACNSYRALFSGLRDLESDMQAHVEKEDNHLFPRALAAEQGLSGKQSGCCGH